MYNKFAKVISIAILLFTIPSITLGLDKNGLFKKMIQIQRISRMKIKQQPVKKQRQVNSL